MPHLHPRRWQVFGHDTSRSLLPSLAKKKKRTKQHKQFKLFAEIMHSYILYRQNILNIVKMYIQLAAYTAHASS